jgi:hypothetical protein
MIGRTGNKIININYPIQIIVSMLIIRVVSAVVKRGDFRGDVCSTAFCDVGGVTVHRGKTSMPAQKQRLCILRRVKRPGSVVLQQSKPCF